MNVERLIPFREAIGLVGIRPTKAYQEVAAARLKVIKNGRRTYVRASEIERYIAALETAAERNAA